MYKTLDMTMQPWRTSVGKNDKIRIWFRLDIKNIITGVWGDTQYQSITFQISFSNFMPVLILWYLLFWANVRYAYYGTKYRWRI